MVLIGCTGVGKSSTGNTILQKPNYFNCKAGGNSVTEKCETATGEINGRPFEIIDTPGLFDTRHSLTHICLEMARCLTLTIPGPHAFLLVFAEERGTEAVQNSIDMIPKVFGKEVWR